MRYSWTRSSRSTLTFMGAVVVSVLCYVSLPEDAPSQRISICAPVSDSMRQRETAAHRIGDVVRNHPVLAEKSNIYIRFRTNLKPHTAYFCIGKHNVRVTQPPGWCFPWLSRHTMKAKRLRIDPNPGMQ